MRGWHAGTRRRVRGASESADADQATRAKKKPAPIAEAVQVLTTRANSAEDGADAPIRSELKATGDRTAVGCNAGGACTRRLNQVHECARLSAPRAPNFGAYRVRANSRGNH